MNDCLECRSMPVCYTKLNIKIFPNYLISIDKLGIVFLHLIYDSTNFNLFQTSKCCNVYLCKIK